MRRFALIAIPYFWLLALFLVPFAIVFKISLSDIALSIPPYLPQLDLAKGWEGFTKFLGALDFFLTLLIGYPIAYAMTRASEEWRPTLLMLVILPFWTSFLIRVYAWIGILGQEGFLNQTLMFLGLTSEPLIILNTPIAVYIGIVYTYLPFMILPIYSALEKLDDSLLEAAEDLGCSRIKAFWLVTFFFSNRDWPLASAVAVILLLILIIPIILFQRNEQKQRESEG